MRSDAWFEQEFAGTRVLAILRGLELRPALAAVTAARQAGDVLAAVARAGAERGLPAGAGTVTAVRQVHLARDAGARFTVSPGTDER
jgi:2-keto-3-deoxy-6-phosphogluconate aldolase